MTPNTFRLTMGNVILMHVILAKPIFVRATPSNIPKWASCGLYKNSGSGEMRLMG